MYSWALRIAELRPAFNSSGTALTWTSGSIPLNSIGFPSPRQRLRTGMRIEATPEGNDQTRLELDEPAD